jgi:ADP-heptose:LPS heptosyltransferase/lauroyl/myristoyl acyltransferase
MAANLRCVCPNLTVRQRRSIARRSSTRLIELGMFALALPFLSKRRIRRSFSLAGDWEGFAKMNRARLLLIPHKTLSEALVLVPCLDGALRNVRVAVLYRPFRNRAIDRLMIKGRRRFGIEPLPRRSGLLTAGHLLKRGHCVALLFDQYAGPSGTQSLFCDRVAIGTDLTEIFAKHSSATVSIAHVERTGPWRGKIVLEPLSSREPVAPAADRWLENKLQEKNFRDDWLWAHSRWKRPLERLLNLQWRKDRLPELLRLRGRKSLPQKTEIIVRMPNYLGDNVMVLPVLRSLRLGRPDARIRLLCPRHYGDWLALFPFVDDVISLPKRGIRYFGAIHRLPSPQPDLHILFTNSVRSDLEALLLQAPVRIGFRVGAGRWRPPLTHLLSVDDDPLRHRTTIWHDALGQIGLPPTLSREPFHRAGSTGRSIAIFPGASDCRSGKCWPPDRWRALVKKFLAEFPERTIYLLGSSGDLSLAEKIGGGLAADRVRNFIGRTTLLDLLRLLGDCALALAVDTGAMHLANCYAVPTVALFGPTNPIATGPFFDGPKALLQPRGCPPTGGLPMERLSVDAVFVAAVRLLSS